MARIRFVALGMPRPQYARLSVRAGKPHTYYEAPLLDYRARIAKAAADAYNEGLELGTKRRASEGPVCVKVVFAFARPKLHYAKQGIRPKYAKSMPAKRPDLDKLLRALCDGLTAAGVIADDAQVVQVLAWKQWATEAHTEVELSWI